MMRIGVLTLPFNNNYGGYLQCIALMETLRQMGHEVILINRRPNVRMGIRGFLKNFIKNVVLGDKTRVYNTATFEKRYRRQGENMLSFVDKYIPLKTPPIYGMKDYDCLKKFHLDAIIVGSDQVWRPRMVPDVRDFFLPQISNDVRKIAYAASFGTSEMEYDEELLSKCKEWLKSFHAVSVREHSGVDLLCKYFAYDKATAVIDPTMLLSQKDYKAMFSMTSVNKRGIFAYILDKSDSNDAILTKCSADLRSDVIYFNEGNTNGPKPSIKEWIEGIYNAQFVVTDSFHGTVFSILLNRPFYTIGNKMRGLSRMEDLLSRFDLQDRLISSAEEVKQTCPPIQWDIINDKINKEKFKAVNFLKTNLA